MLPMFIFKKGSRMSQRFNFKKLVIDFTNANHSTELGDLNLKRFIENRAWYYKGKPATFNEVEIISASFFRPVTSAESNHYNWVCTQLEYFVDRFDLVVRLINPSRETTALSCSNSVHQYIKYVAEHKNDAFIKQMYLSVLEQMSDQALVYASKLWQIIRQISRVLVLMLNNAKNRRKEFCRKATLYKQTMRVRERLYHANARALMSLLSVCDECIEIPKDSFLPWVLLKTHTSEWNIATIASQVFKPVGDALHLKNEFESWEYHKFFVEELFFKLVPKWDKVIVPRKALIKSICSFVDLNLMGPDKKIWVKKTWVAYVRNWHEV